MSKWISVEEGDLPECLQDIIFCAEYNGSLVSFAGYFEKNGFEYLFHCSEMEFPYEEVTHWMPLPEPPKGG